MYSMVKEPSLTQTKNNFWKYLPVRGLGEGGGCEEDKQFLHFE